MTGNVMPPVVLQGTAELTFEDGGQAGILTVDSDHPRLFVRIQSWVDGGRSYDHHELNKLEDRKLKITIEEI